MKRALLIGFAACAFALAPALSASAMPAATPNFWSARMRQSSRCEGVTVMVAAIWDAVAEAITTVGAEVAIAAGGKF